MTPSFLFADQPLLTKSFRASIDQTTGGRVPASGVTTRARLDSSAVLVVVMGVAGVGKTTVGRLVAEELGLPFHDADALHSEANREKMAAGIPLTDEDREPWLRSVAVHMATWEQEGGAVVACSALRAPYRERLAAASPGNVAFVFLDAPPETIRARLADRPGHYMPL